MEDAGIHSLRTHTSSASGASTVAAHGAAIVLKRCEGPRAIVLQQGSSLGHGLGRAGRQAGAGKQGQDLVPSATHLDGC